MNYLLWLLRRDRPDEAALLRPGGNLHIGRRAANDLRLTQLSSPGVYLQVSHDGDSVRVRDVSNTAGFKVNGGEATLEAVLRPGDWLRLARERLWLEEAPAVDPAWLAWQGGTVLQLARSIRESGDVSLLPLLADALEDAGCSDNGLLAPLRGVTNAQPSWVVELLSGKG